MSENITVPKEEFTNLEKRVDQLAKEKARLQLIIHMMQKLSTVPGLENTVENMLRIVLENIGGTNLIIYYVIDTDIYYMDVLGKKMKVSDIEDDLVKKVFDTGEFIEYEHDFENTKMRAADFSLAWTWVFPLVVGSEIIGVFKMENIFIRSRELQPRLPVFFDYAALLLKNEILGYTKLKKAYNQLEQEIMVRERVEQALWKSEEQYQTILQTALDGFWIIDFKSRFLDVNESYCQMIGYSRDELLKMSVQDIEASEGETDIAQHIKHVMEIGHDRFESKHKCKDGHIIDIEVSTNYLPNDNKLFVFLRDITKRRRSEVELRKLWRAVEHSSASIVITDTTGAIEYVNPKFTALTGYTFEEAIGKNPRILKSGKTPQEEYTCLWDTITSGHEWKGKFCNKKKNGELYWEAASISPVTNEAGVITNYVAVKEDIMERKQIEEALRESEEKFRSLFNNMIEGVALHKIIYDTNNIPVDYRLIDVNPAYEKHTGLNMNKAKGKLGSKLYGIDPPPYLDIYAKVGETGEPYAFETYSPPMQKHFHIACVSPRKGWFATIFEDITERKKAESEHIRLQNLESLGILAGGIAHDFNNLLTSILGHASLIQVETQDKTVRKSISRIIESTRKGTVLTQQFLTFAKGGIPIKTEVSVRELIENATNFSLTGSNVQAVFRFSEKLIIEADPGQLTQAIQNIVINAKEAMPGGGKVKISTEDIRDDEKPYIKITIKDTGIGIPKKDINKIFDPYFSTKPRGSEKGSGLGLSVSYSIIKRHNGKISVESQEGVGTTFEILLPSVEKEKETEIKEGEQNIVY